jgi:hypothetical protein
MSAQIRKTLLQISVDFSNMLLISLILLSPYIYLRWDRIPRVWLVLPLFLLLIGIYFTIRMQNTKYYISHDKYVIIKIFGETVYKIAISDILYIQSDYIVGYKGKMRNISEIYTKDEKRFIIFREMRNKKGDDILETLKHYYEVKSITQLRYSNMWKLMLGTFVTILAIFVAIGLNSAKNVSLDSIMDIFMNSRGD